MQRRWCRWVVVVLSPLDAGMLVASDAVDQEREVGATLNAMRRMYEQLTKEAASMRRSLNETA